MALKFNGSTVNSITFNGRNLQPVKDWAERTINGVTCSIVDGVGHLNGTSTAGSWQQTEIGTIFLPPGTYTIYFWTNFVQTTTPQLLSKLGLGLRNTNHEDLYPCNVNKYHTFTINSPETFNIVFWWQSANMVFNNIWIKSMVTAGEYDSTTTFDRYPPNNQVKKLVYNGNIAWCKPYTFTLNKTGSSIYSCSITSVEEPTASTGSIANGDTIYYNSAAKFQFTEGSESSTSSTTNPSSVTAPVVTSKFTGSLGATIKNNNNFSVTAYYYIYRAGTRVPSSGYNSTTIAANSNVTLTGLASASYANQTTIYVYFSASATVTNTTTTTTYSGSVTGLRSKNTTSAPLGNLETITITGIVDDAVTFNVSKASSSSVTSTSSTTIKSTTTSHSLGY